MFSWLKNLLGKLFSRKAKTTRGDWKPRINPPKRSKEEGPSIHMQKKAHKARIMDKIRKASRKINRRKK